MAQQAPPDMATIVAMLKGAQTDDAQLDMISNMGHAMRSVDGSFSVAKVHEENDRFRTKHNLSDADVAEIKAL